MRQLLLLDYRLLFAKKKEVLFLQRYEDAERGTLAEY